MNDGAERIIARLKAMRERYAPNSPELKTALTRVGTVLQAEMRLNVRRQGIIDSGRLQNAIEYMINGDTLEVGPRGIAYAARQEFGGELSPRQVRAMFYYSRLRGRKNVQSKNVVTVRPDGSGYWRPRPYVSPAFKKHRNFILDILRGLNE